MSNLNIVSTNVDILNSVVSTINEAKVLSEQIKQDNASLTTEEKVAILQQEIEKSSNLKIDSTKDWRTVFVWEWMFWFNVSSKETWYKVGTIRHFDKDANVIFQQYWSKTVFKLWKLTKDWLVKIKKAE